MPAKKDLFGNADKTAKEITVRAGLDRSGVSLKAKSRAVSALDRLIGAAFDIPGIWFERRAERARIIAVTEQETLKIDANAFLASKKASISTVSRSDPSWIEDLSKRIGNRAGVASYAIEYIQEAKTPDGRPDDGSSDGSDMEDWMNAFVHRAEMASSEAMRSILGRILSREILVPESFSVATLRIVTELDRKSATLFQDLCLARFQDRHIIKKDDEVQGVRMYELYDLEERGLLKEVGGNISIALQKQQDGFYYFREKDKMIRFVIEPIGEYIPVSNVLNTFLLTNSGHQLAQLLPHSEETTLDSIASVFASRDAVKEIDIFNVTPGGVKHIKSVKTRK